MTTEHTGKLKEFLKKQPNNFKHGILFFDNIDKKRVDLDVFYEPSEDKVFIAGDEGEIYEFKELDLIDTL